jgi:hypothetical protein
MRASVLRLTSQGNVEARTENDLLVVFRAPSDLALGLDDVLDFQDLVLGTDNSITNVTRGTTFLAPIAADNVHDLRMKPTHGSSRSPSLARVREP